MRIYVKKGVIGLVVYLLISVFALISIYADPFFLLSIGYPIFFGLAVPLFASIYNIWVFQKNKWNEKIFFLIAQTVILAVGAFHCYVFIVAVASV